MGETTVDSADQSGGQGAGSRPPPVGVPRRFGIGSLLGITTLFSVIFFIAQAGEIPWQAVVGTSVFFGLIGVAQWIIGEGPRARRVSMIVGGVALPLIVFAGALAIAMVYGPPPSTLITRTDPATAVIAIVILCFLGVPFGYVAGTLVAGVFLVTHWSDDWIARRLHPEPDQTPDPNASED